MSEIKFPRIITEDGEIGLFVPEGQGYRISSQKQTAARRRYFETQRLREVQQGRRWLACYHEPIKGVSASLSLTEAGALVKLLPFMRFKSGGKLVQAGEPMKQVDIMSVLGKNKRQTSELLSALQEAGVIRMERAGRSNIYYIEAALHTIGTVRRGESFTKLYQVEARQLLESLSLTEAGLLYKMLPYFHYDNYYLCGNPDEPDRERVELLTQKDLAHLVQAEPKTVSRNMKALRDKGAIMQIKSGRAETFLVNPDLMFRRGLGLDDYTRGIRELFSDLKRAGAQK